MNGNESYRKQIQDRTMKYLRNNPYYSLVLEDFYDWMGSSKEDVTKYDYITLCNRFLEYIGKDCNQLELSDYVLFLSCYTTNSPSYQVHLYAALSLFSKFLYKTGISSANYMEDVNRPSAKERQETITKRENSVLTDEQIKLLIHNVKNGVGTSRMKKVQSKFRERDEFLIMFMLSTGIRRSALVKMDIEDVKTDNDGKTFIRTTEKRNDVRDYYVTNDMEILLHSYIEFREEFLDGTEQQALFISKDKTRISAVAIDKLIKKYGEGIDGISPHKLRATFATKLYKETGDIYFVQQAMGHSSATTTERYVRGMKDDIRRAGTQIMSDKLFGL